MDLFMCSMASKYSFMATKRVLVKGVQEKTSLSENFFRDFSPEKSAKLENSCFYPAKYPSNYRG
jgi:hypothetical protein